MKVKTLKVAMLLLMLTVSQNANASLSEASDFFNDHARGWFWYEAPPQEPEEPEVPPLEGVMGTVMQKAPDPLEELSAVRQTIERALAKAMLEPTTDNIALYLKKQHDLTSQAHQFAKTWEKTLLEHPELNDALVRPTNSMGAQVYLEEKQKARSSAIEKLSRESGLFFFYRSTCPYCQRFAPILKAFAERHHLSVIPITTDGISLPEFPDSLIDNGQSAKFNVQVEPSLFAVNPYTQMAYPIAYGLVSEEELSQRILDIATEFKESTR